MKSKPLYEVRTIKNLKEMLESSASIYKNKAAFLIKTEKNGDYNPVSYTQFKQDVDALGTALMYYGLFGKRIALIGENRYEWVLSYLATVNGVGVIVPLDKELPQNEIESLLVRSKANCIIYSGSMREKVEAASQNLTSVKLFIDMDETDNSYNIKSFRQLLNKGYEQIQKGERCFIDSEIDNEEMNMLLFTSGTTETAKAVMLSHKNICSNLMSMCSMLYIGEKDIFLSILPLHHAYECTCGFLCQIYRGTTVAFCEGLRHIPKNLQESKATVMLGVPLIFEAIYRRIWEQAAKKKGAVSTLKFLVKLSNFLRKFNIDLTKVFFKQIHSGFGGHIRLFISGAAGMDPEVAKGFRNLGINIVQGYGLTECSPIAALNRDVDFKDDAAGLPLPGLEVKIDNPNSESVGEITVKGLSVMLGYYENPAETSKVLKDGWFYTGDLGFIDKDKFVHITGRKKNVIVTKNGKNIFPEEIETLLNRSLYIKESLVVGETPEGSDDVTVTAVIVPDIDNINASFADSSLSQDFIHKLIKNEIKSVNKELVNYKHIKDFRLRETEFIKTTTKKIKRYLQHQV